MKAFYATQFVLPLPPGHRFPMGKYQRLRDRLAQECPGLVLDQAEPTADADLALAHAPAYIEAVARGTLTPLIRLSCFSTASSSGPSSGDSACSSALA